MQQTKRILVNAGLIVKHDRIAAAFDRHRIQHRQQPAFVDGGADFNRHIAGFVGKLPVHALDRAGAAADFRAVEGQFAVSFREFVQRRLVGVGVRFADRVGDLRGGGRAHGVGGRGVIDDAVVVGVVNRFEHIAG